MGVTLTGALLMVLGLYFFMAKAKYLMPSLVFFASFSGTAIVNFSNLGISPGALFLVLYLAHAVVSGHLGRPVLVGRNHPGVVLCIGAFAGYALGTLLLKGAGQGLSPLQLSQTAYLFFGVILMTVLSVEMSREQSLEMAIGALRAGACFIAGWGVIQAACFYAGIEYPAYLFNNSTSHFADMFDQRAGDGVIRIASVATEPSFMANSLMIFGAFGATLVVCEPKFRTKAWVLPVLLVLVVVVASTSTTGFFALAVLAMLLAVRRPGVIMLAGICVLIIAVAAFVLLPTFRKAMYNMTIGKSSTSSYVDRTASFGNAIAVFVAHPWVGGGWGGDFSYSIITNLLANVGLIGSALFVVALAGTILTSYSARHQMRDDKQWRLQTYAMGAENAMIVYMAQAAVSGFHYVVPDFWVLWAFCLAIPSNLMRAAAHSHQAAVRVSEPDNQHTPIRAI